METTEQKPEQIERPAPTGVDLLHSLLARIAGLESRMLEVERCKHTDHTIPVETLNVIKDVVRAHIAEVLSPKSAEQTEQKSE